MIFGKVALSMLIGFALAPAALAQPDFSALEFETRDLGGGVYMLEGGGGNVGLFTGDDGVVLIDDGYVPLAEKLVAAVADVTERPISYVLNTHWHFDHTGANELMGDSGAVVVAHNNVRKRMSTEQFVEALGRKFEPSPAGALPVVTFTAELRLHLNGDEVRVRHIHHAHTDGDAIVHLREANVIHAGDTYWNGFYPLIDLSSGGGIDGMIRAANAMLAMADDDTQIIPGHGPLSNRRELTGYRDMLETVAARVNAMLAHGFSKSAAMKAEPLKDLNEEWGDGFMQPETFLGIVYDDLAAK